MSGATAWSFETCNLATVPAGVYGRANRGPAGITGHVAVGQDHHLLTFQDGVTIGDIVGSMGADVPLDRPTTIDLAEWLAFAIQLNIDMNATLTDGDVQDAYSVFRQSTGDHKCDAHPWDSRKERLVPFAEWLESLAAHVRRKVHHPLCIGGEKGPCNCAEIRRRLGADL